MRIGLFTDAYLPDINGVVSSVATLKEALEDLGHVVYVISNNKGTKIIEEPNHVLRLPGLELKKFYGYKMSSPIQINADAYIRKMALDVIHVQTEAGVGMFGRQMARVLGIPLIYTYHTMYEDYTHYINPFDLGTIEKFGKFAIRSFSRILGNGSQAVVAPSDKTKDALVRYGVHTPIYVVPTGLDLSDFDRSSLDIQKINQIRGEFGFQEEDHIVVFVGRLAKEKDIEMPIRAMAQVQDPKLKFVIVGSGTDEGYYKKLVRDLHLEDRIYFTGKVPKAQIPYYYAAFDCFVSASTSETQGMTYIEALASGLCVFGRRDDVLKELVYEDQTGYYFDDEEELIQKWDFFFKKSKEERNQMAKDCIQQTEPYTLSMFAHKMVAVYNQAIDDYQRSFEVTKITMMDDFVQLQVERDQDHDNVKFLIPMDDFFEYKIAKHTKLDASMVEIYLDLQPFYKALKSVKRRVMANDYTKFEVQQYCLRHLGLSIDEAQAIVKALEESHLLDDEQYAYDKAQVWHSYGQSSCQIENKLKKAGVQQEYIDQACACLDEKVELNNALQVAQRLKSTVKGQSNRLKRQSIINKLINKGYSMDVAKQAGEQIELDDDEEQALSMTIKKAYRLYASYEGKKKKEKIRLYCLRKGFYSSQIDEMMEKEGIE